MVYPDKKATADSVDAPSAPQPKAPKDPQRLLSDGDASDAALTVSPGRLLPYLPARQLTAPQVRQQLQQADTEVSRQLLAQLVSLAPWDELWTFITPDELKTQLPHLDLPQGLKSAWQAWFEGHRRSASETLDA